MCFYINNKFPVKIKNNNFFFNLKTNIYYVKIKYSAWFDCFISYATF